MKSPQSVLVFVTQYMPTGGIESHLIEFCVHLVKSGVEVDLVVINSSMLAETEKLFRQICRRVYLGKHGRSTLRFFGLLLVGLRLNTKYYNALYTNGQGKSILFFSRLLPRRGRWIHHHHTAGNLADQSTWDESYRKALLTATTVIACSKRNSIEIEDALNRRVRSIPCFSREISGKNQKHRTNLRFGYYGRLIPEKGIDILCKLSADPDFQDIEFHIWGEGVAYPSSFFDTYSNITYHGSFSGIDGLSDVITSIDALLLISTHPEGLPISLLEAMSAGLPWLATDQGGIPDIALDKNSTRVIPVTSSYLEIKVAVASFAIDIKKGKVSSAIQKELYSNFFSPSALISQWQEVLGLS
jgi:glycosyltransferase involved in cell wall biosynthesis